MKVRSFHISSWINNFSTCLWLLFRFFFICNVSLRYRCIAWNSPLSKVNGAAYPQTPVPTSSSRNCSRLQDWPSFPICCHRRPSSLFFALSSHFLSLHCKFRRPLKHTLLGFLRIPTCVQFTPNGLPSCQRSVIINWETYSLGLVS